MTILFDHKPTVYELNRLAQYCQQHGSDEDHARCPTGYLPCPFGNTPCREITERHWELVTEGESHE